MNKSQFIEALAAHYDGNKREASKALGSVVDTIYRQMSKGEKVGLTGFGAFEKVGRPARMVRNPATGQRVRAKKTSVPKFRAGAQLKAVASGAKKLPKLKVAKSSSSARGAATSKAAASSGTARRSAAKSTATKASPSRTPAASKATARTATAKKATSTKVDAKKRAPVKAAAAKKPAAPKSSSSKPTAARSTAKRPTVRKTSKKA